MPRAGLLRILRASPDTPPDGDLLDRFVRDRDGAAFAALVYRHGPMVLGVCRRIAGQSADAEDAFQATFLVLSRKAATVRPRDAVGGWLHGVAVRTALKAKTRNARRRRAERQGAAMAEPATHARPEDAELLRMLDEEIDRLPDSLRVAVVLCELEGRPRAEVARRLGVPEGTLSSRLAAARKRLAARLARRGVTVGTAGLAAVFTDRAVQAVVPPRLSEVVVQSAAAGVGPVSHAVVSLADGVVKAMLLKKLKMVAMVGITLGLAGGVWGAAGGSDRGDNPPAAKKVEPLAKGGKTDPPKKDPAWEAFDRLVAADGDWQKEKPALDDLRALGEKAKDVLMSQSEHHPKERVRQYCYDLLIEQFPKDERVIRTVQVHGLSDKSERIRYMLAFWLGEQKVYDAHRRLRNMVEDKANDERTKLAAAKSLAQLGEGDVLRVLYHGLESDWYMERMMANAGVKALTGKDLNAFGGYDWREGAAISGGNEGVGPFDPIQRADRRMKRYAVIKAFFEWLKDERPDLYKHISGAY